MKRVLLAVLVGCAHGHYEDPNVPPGCAKDEVDVSITGIPGDLCAPPCDKTGKCPTDVPTGVTATPTCALKSSAGAQYCALVCTPAQARTADSQCGPKASCKPTPQAGLCTFDDGPGSKGSAHWKPIKSPTFDQSSLTLAVAFDATGKVGFAPGGTHTGGSEVIKSVDGGSTWSKVYPAANGTAGLDLYLAAATRSLTSSVISGVTSQLYTTDGVTFSKSANGLLFPAQDAHVLPDGGDGGSGPFAIVGSSIVLTSQNGVATSTDGKKWSFHKIGLSSKGYGARYGAFPTETTWYVTAGSWGDKQEAPDPRRRHLSKHVSVAMDNGDDGDNTMDVGFHYNDEEEDGSLQAGNASGWKTAIMKTTDGGVSFTQVYSHDDAGLYPNGIGCASASHCIAALEGLSSSILVTRDGGVTWKVAMHDPDKTSSLTVVKMIDDKEAWVMGGKIAFSGFEGRFWHTLDGGDTWTKETIPGLYIMSANFVSSAAGFAVAITKASGVELLKYRATNATISLR